MKCEELRLQLVDYFDGELTPAEQEALASHLQACAACRELAAKLEKSLAVFQAVALAEPAPGEPAFALPEEEARPTRFSRRLVGWLALAATLIFILGAGVYLRLQSSTPPTVVLEPAVLVTGENLDASISDKSFVLHGHGISQRNHLDLKL